MCHFRHQFILGFVGIRPLISGFEHDEIVRHAGGHGVSGHLRRADLGEDLIDFGKCLQAILQLFLHRNGLLQPGTRNAQGVKRDIPFIQLRNKLGPERGCQPDADGQQRGRAAQHQPAKPHGEPQRGPVEGFGTANDRTFFLADFTAHEDGHGSGHYGQGQHHRRQQGHHHGGGHGVEHFALDAGQRKNR